ncbi:hypothetical protein LOZ12_005510 [Ophidiomyces ophidiicola]|uniref:Uncharacterized protein n=1 Tax=Ophidiomyces ophidiicola TaxID=1387563 RepID=A0ACB8UT03_9EURO|nr:hypothetical protein LOZ64_005307 [Ophidiomyces ophidiicola]KAI1944797.1 hypothetical protein LOZ62_003992 [Ophidiomyces ophidiicola]KAI1953088.1 hypothetical protein LOZ59_005263 [Ophidiomyces ophidiicola]KAI1970678.1 hypothetical protein LOZ56_003527 [Ophidiomyces ophidiicola]KAI2001642.1 hypothetical protein LOZ50_005535 [Ophidiomyces ophidiicola]
MLSAKSVFLFAILALFNIVAAQVPPACLLAAVNTQKNPADVKTLCEGASKDVQEALMKACDSNNLRKAQNAYQTACKQAGIDVSMISAPASANSTTSLAPSGTGSANSTASRPGTATATGGVSGPGSSSGPGVGPRPSGTRTGGPAMTTSNAGSSLKSGSLAAAALAAMLGAIAV